MFERRETGWRRRVLRAALVLLTNVFIWFVIGNLLSSLIAGSIPTTSFTSSLVLTYGIVITALQTLGALTEGMALSVPFNSASYIASAYFTYLALDGGKLSVAVQGLRIQLVFPLLLFMLMLPSLINVVRIPLIYLLEGSEAGREAKDIP
ncbi:MAG: hypothetical protein E6K90_04080 [Thaumarchaeota archaeon]|nr:MAG: hypothetical protein E6K90_04080 [Nitrososphaerota archaeon]